VFFVRAQRFRPTLKSCLRYEFGLVSAPGRHVRDDDELLLGPRARGLDLRPVASRVLQPVFRMSCSRTCSAMSGAAACRR
jgi:hypothetical protein